MRYNEATRKIELLDGPAKAIQHIFERTIDGVGQNKLVREMNENFPPFTHKKNNQHPKWNTSYISKILSDPATYGVYQPYAFDENHERKPDGPPIVGYYPQAVSEQTFNAAQYSKSLRKREKHAKDTFVNVLEGLTTNLIDGSVCHIQTLRQKLTTGETYLQRRLQSYKHRCGVKGSCPLTVDYFPIERLVLQALSELNEESVVTKQTPKEEKAQLEKAMAGLLDQIRQTEDELRISRLPKQITALANLLEHQERTLSTYQTRLKAITPLPEEGTAAPLKDLKSILHQLSEKPKHETTQLLKAVKSKARSLIKAIYIYPVKQSNRRVYADVFLRLANNEGRHILYCPREGFPKELKHLQILDENDVPIISLTPDGIIGYSRRHKGQREEWSHKPAKVIGLLKGPNKTDEVATLPLERPMRSATGYFELYRRQLGIDRDTFNRALDAIEDAPLANAPQADTDA